MNSMNFTDVLVSLELVPLVLLSGVGLLCGLGPMWVTSRITARFFSSNSGSPHSRALLWCFSSGVFLAWSLLDLLPESLDDVRQAFGHLGVTLQFPLAEFVLSVGFLLVCVLEQMLLVFREHSQTDTKSSSTRTRLSGADGGLQVFLLQLCVCVLSLCQSLSADHRTQISVPALLHKVVLGSSLALRLSAVGIRRTLVNICMLLFGITCALGVGFGTLHIHIGSRPQFMLLGSVTEVLMTGMFLNITVSGLMRSAESPKQHTHGLACLLAGFSSITAILLAKI